MDSDCHYATGVAAATDGLDEVDDGLLSDQFFFQEPMQSRAMLITWMHGRHRSWMVFRRKSRGRRTVQRECSLFLCLGALKSSHLEGEADPTSCLQRWLRHTLWFLNALQHLLMLCRSLYCHYIEDLGDLALHEVPLVEAPAGKCLPVHQHGYTSLSKLAVIARGVHEQVARKGVVLDPDTAR